MKYAFIADIHLAISDSLSPYDTKTGFSIRTLDKFEAIEKALKTSIDEKCEAFFFMGDVYDKLNPPERLKEAFLRTIMPYCDKIKIHLIPGNHDGADFTNNYLSETAIFEFLGEQSPFTIYHEPETIYLNNGKDKFLMCPWIADHKIIVELIKMQEEGIYFIGHLEVAGALASTEYVLTKGINPNTFQKFKYVFLGHYHRYQRPAQNIVYVGSPIIKDFGEKFDEIKGFIIYDSNTNVFDRFPLETRQAYSYIISKENLAIVDQQLAQETPPKGSLIELNFEGTKEWINEYVPGVMEIFNEFEPLKIKKTKTVFKEVNKEYIKILELNTRIDKIKELSKDETPYVTELGLKLYQEAENEYLEVKG